MAEVEILKTGEERRPRLIREGPIGMDNRSFSWESKGTAEQILAERVAVKIGMIIRRATLVVVGTTMPRSATP